MSDETEIQVETETEHESNEPRRNEMGYLIFTLPDFDDGID